MIKLDFKKIILFSVLMVLIAAVVYAAIPNPGHDWSSIGCISKPCQVGIGLKPGEKPLTSLHVGFDSAVSDSNGMSHLGIATGGISDGNFYGGFLGHIWTTNVGSDLAFYVGTHLGAHTPNSLQIPMRIVNNEAKITLTPHGDIYIDGGGWSVLNGVGRLHISSTSGTPSNREPLYLNPYSDGRGPYSGDVIVGGGGNNGDALVGLNVAQPPVNLIVPDGDLCIRGDCKSGWYKSDGCTAVEVKSGAAAITPGISGTLAATTFAATCSNGKYMNGVGWDATATNFKGEQGAVYIWCCG